MVVWDFKAGKSKIFYPCPLKGELLNLVLCLEKALLMLSPLEGIRGEQKMDKSSIIFTPVP